MHGSTAIALAAALVLAPPDGAPGADGSPPEKVSVYVLAGQSNMEGHGQLRSLPHLGDAYADHLALLRDDDGGWRERDDVTIAWKGHGPDGRGHGPLGVGWGANESEIGPELLFGALVGERTDAPVLLIKTAWGGKDVFCDFRSPSAGEPKGDAAKLLARERERGEPREVGRSYRQMIDEVRDTLAHIDSIVPGYEGQGYELAGFVWFQGWNDYCRWHEGMGVIDDYADGLAAMIRDLRKDLDAPNLPVAIGELGVGGRTFEERLAKNSDDGEARAMVAFRRAQRDVAESRRLEGVTFVPTADFWDARLDELRDRAERYGDEKQRKGEHDDKDLPTQELSDEYRSLGGHWYCHYNGSAEHYSLVGAACADALVPAKRSTKR
ncbi:MAG: sialate O-acetylesterase [Planctomycetota bacterium]